MSAARVTLAVLVSLVVAAGATPLVISWLVRRGNFDVPNARSSHSRPVPRGGGMAVMVATVAGAMAAGHPTWRLAVPLVASLLLGAVGVVEDLHGLTPPVRLGIQIAIAACGAIGLDQARTGELRHVAQVVVVVGFVAVLCNVVNFMDGINGITAAQSIATGSFLAVYGHLEHVVPVEIGGLAVVGAMLGFLPFNFPAARVFLGDSGSYFLGGWLAFFTSLAFVRGLNPIVLLAPFLVYLADAFTTIVRRLLRREAIMEPHRDHAYQRLVQAGWSHARTTQTVFALIAFHCAVALLLRSAPGVWQAAGAVAIGLTLLAYLTLPFVVARPVPAT